MADPDPQVQALLEDLNIGGAHSLVVPSEYLEVVITKTGSARS